VGDCIVRTVSFCVWMIGTASSTVQAQLHDGSCSGFVVHKFVHACVVLLLTCCVRMPEQTQQCSKAHHVETLREMHSASLFGKPRWTEHKATAFLHFSC
jgi:hypothetical protein